MGFSLPKNIPGMAGMFSMLNSNFRNEGGGNPAGSSGRDEGGMGAKGTPRVRANASKRQLYLMNGSRCFEIQPQLRRSICTLILAFLGIICGIIVILIDYFVFENDVSIFGVVILISGLVLVIVGLLWFYRSKRKLLKKWERWEESRQKKLKNTSATFEKSSFLPLTLMTSKHVAKWPAKSNCILDECRETMTSPNGNHYVTPFESSCSESEDEMTSLKEKCDQVSLSGKTNGCKIKPHSNNFDPKAPGDVFISNHCPIRITKNGDYYPVATTEQYLNHFQPITSLDDDEIATSSLPGISSASLV